MTGEYWNLSPEELAGRIGTLDQLMPVRRFRFTEGKAKDVEAIEAGTGAGLSLLFLADRGLDLFDMRWCGRGLNWLSPAGIVAPAYYEREGAGWLRGFGGGMVTTCGLRNVGVATREEGESFGVHGEISYTPASAVTVRRAWSGNRLQLEISGEIREAHLFGPNLVVRRRWRTELGASWVELEDVVTNEGWRPEIHMQLYHCNLGFPLLNEQARLYLSTTAVEPRDAAAAAGVEHWNRFEAPQPEIAEQVFYHSRGDAPLPAENSALLVADSRTHDFGLQLRWPTDTLPYLVQWKLCAKGSYVLGIEPANCLVGGRNWHRQTGLAPLAPGASVRHRLRLQVLPSADAVAGALDLVSR